MKETNKKPEPDMEWTQGPVSVRMYRKTGQKGTTFISYALTRKWTDTKGQTRVTHGLYPEHIDTAINLLMKAKIQSGAMTKSKEEQK